MKYALLLALALAAPASLAQGVAPDALLRAVAADVIDNIKQDQERQVSDPAKVAALVETWILPLFDFVHMTRLAVARRWKIYDVKVAGVRLVTTYRDVFAEKVREGGVDGLIQFLVDENRGAARDSIPSRPRSGKSPA